MPVPSSITELSQTPGDNSPPGSESPTTADNYLRTYSAFTAMLRDGKGFSEELDVASAATCDVGAVNSMFVRITGTTTITSLGTNYNGPRFIRFASALTLTYNASTLVLPGGLSILTSPGDSCIATPLPAGGWVINQYQEASGRGFFGQCRLVKTGANLFLSTYQGNRLTINGINQVIPASLTLAPTSLTPDTNYYIYAYMNAGTMTLEASATTHATDTATGVEIKSGDATRTLVGFARVITGPAWQDSSSQKFVLSWFNRQPLNMSAAFTAGRSITSASYAELNSEIRNEFLTWAGEVVSSHLDGQVSNASNNGSCFTSIAFDGSSQEAMSGGQSYAATAAFPVACSAMSNSLSEGYHYATVVGSTGGGTTGTWRGSATPGDRCSLKTTVMG